MIRRAAILFAASAATAAVAGAALTARAAVGLLEARVMAQVGGALGPSDDWVELAASGTILTIGGSAPDRAHQIATLARIGTVAGGISILDATQVASEAEELDAPEALAALSLEVLRSGETLTVFGAVPQADRDGLVAGLELPTALEVSDMLEAVEGRVDPRWSDTLDLARFALTVVGDGRVSVTPGTAMVSASAQSEMERAEWLVALDAATPDGITLDADIHVPRPIVSPFVFRATHGAEGGLSIQACTAETAQVAARLAQLQGSSADCAVGLGAPSANWEAAVVASLEAVEELGGGTLDMADADIAITGPRGHSAPEFAAVLEALSDRLPDGFSLTGSVPPLEAEVDEIVALEPPRFMALRTEDGAVRIRGDVNDVQMQETATTLAEAKFGFNTVINETTPRADLPPGWAANIVGGLEALGGLSMGQLEVTEGALSLTGFVPSAAQQDEIVANLSERLSGDIEVILEVREAEALLVEPLRQIPAELCAEQIDLILASAKIIFPPSETAIDETSLPIVDRIAEVLADCPGARFEIGGHTDSQGRESSNMALSQARADAVLAALLERNVDTVFLLARGFGESDPIADNETEEGRAQNRRIAFNLIEDRPAAEGGTGEEDAGAGDVVQAAVEDEDGATEDVIDTTIDTARRESPTVIVVPSGTDPTTVLPRSALPQIEPDPADGDQADVDPASGEEAISPATTLERAVAAAVDAVPSQSADEEEAVAGATDEPPAEEGREVASSEDAAAPTTEEAAEAEPEPAAEPQDQAQSDQIRPMPRRGNLPGAGE